MTPAPKIINLQGDAREISIKPGYGNGFRKNHAYFFNWLDESIKSNRGVEKSIKISISSSSNIPDSLQEYMGHPSAYLLNIGKERIQILSADTSGILNAFVTLKKLLEKNDGKLSEGYIIDWPDFTTRVFHFVARGVTEVEALNLLKKARYYNFNTIIIQLADGVKLESMEGLYRHDAWDKDFLKEFSIKAEELDLEFIPEIKFLTHQEKLLKGRYPALMYNRFTYDPRLPETQQKAKEILDELTELIAVNAIHVGHDEVFGAYEYHPDSKKEELSEGEPLTAQLFKESILFLYDYLTEKNIKMWMWGDMFLQRSAYPEMFQWSLHGDENYASLIDEIPRDIVICDWHYWDNQTEFPSASFFSEKGFRTIGATWKKEHNIKNFSSDVDHLNKHENGMMATTWFHVQRDEWGVVEDILQTSGEHFWNAD